MKTSSIIGALGAIIVAVMGLVGYLPGMGLLGSIRENYIPMAPSTAINFILLGIVLSILNVKQFGAKVFISLVALLVALFGLLEVVGYFSRLDLNFEDLLVPAAGTLNGIPLARMSPATGAAFFLSGTAVFFLIRQRKSPKHNLLAEIFGPGLGILVLLISFVFCLAYLYGTPLLYGVGTTIPMALTTALGFVFISISILTFDENLFPLRLLAGTSTRSYLLRFILPLSAISVLFGGLVVLFSERISRINPAFMSAALTVLIALISGFVATLMSRHMGSKIDKAEVAVIQINKDLRVSEARLRAVVETAKDAIITVSSRGEISGWNAGAQKMFGYSVEEINGQSLTLIIPERYREDHQSGLRQVTSGGKPKIIGKTVELAGLQKDGSEFPIEISVAAWESEEEIFFTAIIRNIAKRKRAADALREYSERLEEMVAERTKDLEDTREQLVRREKLAVLGQLAGGVAHELRNPLGVLANAIYFLKTVLSDADDTVKEYLEIISSEIGKAEKIIADLLGFSHTRLTEEKMRESVTVSALVTQVLAQQSPPEQIEVSTQIPADLPPVIVDSQQIDQVLTNLVINAYQAMPNGGKLIIKAATQQDMLLISVTDDGGGISPENLTRAFEPLFTTKAKGIGLGLAVSRNLAEANQGNLTVESEEGMGSTFILRLPTGE